MLEENDNKLIETIKIILLGNSGIGKTSIINQYYLKEFKTILKPTATMNYIVKDISIKGRNIKLNIWDTVGQEKYRSCNKLFVKNSNIVILVYDITQKQSFKELDYWYNFIKGGLGQDYFLGLVGNKLDMVDKEEVSEEEGKAKAKEWGAYFSLLSAKEDPDGIENYFEEIVKLYLESVSSEFQLIESLDKIRNIRLDKIELNENIDMNKKCCGGGESERRSIIKKNVKKDFSIIFFGCKGVGKTNIIQAIKGKKINNKYEPTKNINKVNYAYSLENKKKINVKLIDTYENISDDNIKKEFKNCKLIFLVFDIYKRNTFNDLEKYINQIKKLSEDNIIHICILGNKINIKENNENDIISEEEAKQFAEKYNTSYENVCIKDVNNIQTIINNKINSIYNSLI